LIGYLGKIFISFSFSLEMDSQFCPPVSSFWKWPEFSRDIKAGREAQA